MSAAASAAAADIKVLKGSLQLQDWFNTIALAMSHSFVESDDDLPLLIFGFDLLQDGDLPNVKVELRYEGSNQLFGISLGSEQDADSRKLEEVALVASCPVEEGEELTVRYLEEPHAGAYLERYGFVPPRLLAQADASTELVFTPVTDEETDPLYYEKQNHLGDLGLRLRPIPFLFVGRSSTSRPRPGQEKWTKARTMDKMCWTLRFRHLGGKDSFLIDTVFEQEAWSRCCGVISLPNEELVSKSVLEESQLWLSRFEEADKWTVPEGDEDSIAGVASEVRSGEAALLSALAEVFEQEIRTLRGASAGDIYQTWADRQMSSLFPQSARNSPGLDIPRGYQD